MPFGIHTIVIPFTVSASPARRRGGGMTRMRPAGELYRYGLVAADDHSRPLAQRISAENHPPGSHENLNE